MADGTRFALGSGGSNRIRSAITQVLVNLLDFGMTPEQAVAAPRIHLEGDMLSLEPGFAKSRIERSSRQRPGPISGRTKTCFSAVCTPFR